MITENDSPPQEISRAKEMAREVIAHHFGSRPRRIEHKATGLSNFVFAVKHAEGEFIVRISFDPARINLFIKEQWAQEKAREAGVPTAEILEVGNEFNGNPFMISRTVAGSEATHHPNRLEILREMGRYAAQINSIPDRLFRQHFRLVEQPGFRARETWKEYLQKELRLKII